MPYRSLVLVLLAGCAFRPAGSDLPDDGDGSASDAAPGDDGAAGDAPASDVTDADVDAAAALCPPGYVTSASGTYRLVTTVATWNAARTDCADDDDVGRFAFHTHMVVLSGETERIDVRTTFAGPKLWLGVSDRVTTGTWRWVTLEDTNGYPPASGTPWKGGQPNDGNSGGDDCVIMEGNGLWDDRLCGNDTEPYLCECDASAEVAAQSDPQN